MSLDNLHTVTPSIADAIDQQVLTVTAQMSVTAVVHQMSMVWGNCNLSTGLTETAESTPLVDRQLSCALIIERGAVIGILTERDIVRLTAANLNFDCVTVGEVMTTPVKTLQLSAFQDIFAVLFLFRRYRIRHLPIVDEQSQLVGIVTPESIRRVLRPVNLLKMRRVSDIMTRSVLHAPSETTVIELAHLMANHQVSCIVIAETDRQITRTKELQTVTPLGIVTERDIVQFQALQLNLSRLIARDIMSTPLFLLNPEDSLWTAHQEMQKRHVRRLVVSWDWGGGLGLVTQTSLLKVFDPIEMYGIIETLQRTIQQLKTTSSTDQLQPLNPLSSAHNSQLPHPENRLSEPFSDSITPSLSLSLPVDQLCSTSDIENLLLDIEARLISLTVNADLSEQQRQLLISSALVSLQKVQSVIRG